MIETPLWFCATLPVLSAAFAAWIMRKRWRNRIRSMWIELGLRTEHHGPLDNAEIIGVVDRWTT